MEKVILLTTKSEKKEMCPIYKYVDIKTALDGLYDVKLIEYSSDKDLSCTPYDVVIVETRSNHVIQHLRCTSSIDTSECDYTRAFNFDKRKVKELSVRTPKLYSLSEINDYDYYFVKPVFSENSIGIDNNSICHGRNEVLNQIAKIKSSLGLECMVEQFISGIDVTVGVINDNGYHVGAVKLITNTVDNILTKDVKDFDKEIYEKTLDPLLFDTAVKVFEEIKAKHYIRIDMRIEENTGIPYVLEINLYPGLAKNGYMSHCYPCYKDMLIHIINSAKV